MPMFNPSNPEPLMTWEQAVEWMRNHPGRDKEVEDNYFDDSVWVAAERYHSGEEWQAARSYLPHSSGKALEIGAGRGIVSYAMARDGWEVVALEPDPSNLVGCGAIRALVDYSGVRISIKQGPAEDLPFIDGIFDLVVGRQVLHHVADMPRFCLEAARVLKPGGRFIMTREPVVDTPADLQVFLERHPLHRLYGGEAAFPLQIYTGAIRNAGLKIMKVVGHLESAVNYAPMSMEDRCEHCRRVLNTKLGWRMSHILTNERTRFGRFWARRLSPLVSRLSTEPGRLVSFVATKMG